MITQQEVENIALQCDAYIRDESKFGGGRVVLFDAHDLIEFCDKYYDLKCSTIHNLVGLVYNGQDGYGASLMIGIPNGTRLYSTPQENYGWISIKDKLPVNGEKILGCNVDNPDANNWSEVFDIDEPLGFMTHWIPEMPII